MGGFSALDPAACRDEGAKAGKLAEMLTKIDLVILDEPGYLPFSSSGGALLFHLLSKLYERTSVVITTNLSFSEWALGPVAPCVRLVTGRAAYGKASWPIGYLKRA